MAQHHYLIIEGPSKMDFMLAIFDGGPNNRRPVVFRLVDPDPHPDSQLQDELTSFILDGAEREDGGGENWIFKGFYHLGKVSKIPAHGFFSTSMRRGWMEF